MNPSKENYQKAFNKQNEYEKLKHKSKIITNIKSNCKSLFKYAKSQTKIHKNVST